MSFFFFFFKERIYLVSIINRSCCIFSIAFSKGLIGLECSSHLNLYYTMIIFQFLAREVMLIYIRINTLTFVLIITYLKFCSLNFLRWLISEIQIEIFELLLRQCVIPIKVFGRALSEIITDLKPSDIPIQIVLNI